MARRTMERRAGESEKSVTVRIHVLWYHHTNDWYTLAWIILKRGII